jgi:hypothetical protein
LKLFFGIGNSDEKISGTYAKAAFEIADKLFHVSYSDIEEVFAGQISSYMHQITEVVLQTSDGAQESATAAARLVTSIIRRKGGVNARRTHMG